MMAMTMAMARLWLWLAMSVVILLTRMRTIVSFLLSSGEKQARSSPVDPPPPPPPPPPPAPPQIWRGKSPTPFFSFVTLSHLKATNFSVESISYDTIASALVSPSTLKKNNCSIRENRMWRLGEMGVCDLPLASSSRAASPPPRAPVPGQAARGSHAAGRGTFAQGRRPPRAPRG